MGQSGNGCSSVASCALAWALLGPCASPSLSPRRRRKHHHQHQHQLLRKFHCWCHHTHRSSSVHSCSILQLRRTHDDSDANDHSCRCTNVFWVWVSCGRRCLSVPVDASTCWSYSSK